MLKTQSFSKNLAIAPYRALRCIRLPKKSVSTLSTLSKLSTLSTVSTVSTVSTRKRVMSCDVSPVAMFYFKRTVNSKLLERINWQSLGRSGSRASFALLSLYFLTQRPICSEPSDQFFIGPRYTRGVRSMSSDVSHSKFIFM